MTRTAAEPPPVSIQYDTETGLFRLYEMVGPVEFKDTGLSRSTLMSAVNLADTVDMELCEAPCEICGAVINPDNVFPPRCADHSVASPEPPSVGLALALAEQLSAQFAQQMQLGSDPQWEPADLIVALLTLLDRRFTEDPADMLAHAIADYLAQREDLVSGRDPSMTDTSPDSFHAMTLLAQMRQTIDKRTRA